VNIAMACLAVFWAVLLGIESVLHHRARPDGGAAPEGGAGPEGGSPLRRV
jgi:hypothetical protein